MIPDPSPLVAIAADLLLAALQAAKLSGDEAAEVERQAMIKAQRDFVLAQARKELKG